MHASEFLPLFIRLRDRSVVIIGGGSVGERKAELFCKYARTIVVSFEFTERLLELGAIERVTTDRDMTDEEITDLVKDAFLVIPATDDLAYNERISTIASRNKALVNRVDDLGDVIIPSVITRGDITIGISTLANSPALSRYIREQIEGVITPEYAEMARLQNEVREYLKDVVPDQKMRHQMLRAILDDEAVWALLLESYEKAYEEAKAHYETVP